MAEVTILGPLRVWEDDWRGFARSFPGLSRSVNSTSPIYCLPEAVITCLARGCGSARRSPPQLDKATVDAETEFAELCKKHHAIGCFSNLPIQYPYLSWCPPLFDTKIFRGMLSSTQLQQVEQCLKTTDDTSLRLKGYAGWLLTEPAFLAEIKKLSELWLALPHEFKPTAPLVRPLRISDPLPGLNKAPESLARFTQALHAFLDRWELMQMTTWDLPSPQGPFLPNDLPAGSPALPAQGVHLVLPLHYPLQRDDDIMKQIQNSQSQLARDHGLDESLAGLTHFKMYGNMLDVIHLENVIRSRFPSGRGSCGLVSLIVDAVASALDCSTDQVHKLRKMIRACRAGKRARLSSLRPRRR